MGATSIPCDETTRDRLKNLKSNNESWDEFLNAMADEFSGTSNTNDLEARVTDLERRVSDIESMATR